MHILLVEPDAILAAQVLEALRREGFTPDHVSELDPATPQDRDSYHMFIMDKDSVCMERQGPCRRLQTMSTMPILLVLTSQAAVEHRVGCLRCGSDDVLVRPFAVEELVARVVALFRRRRHRLIYGNLALDLVKRQAEYDGMPVALTNRELELLTFFMQHPDEVLSREVLATEVWNTLFDPGTNVVDVYVTYLRRKLGTHGPSLIHTVRGRGYRFGRVRELPQVSEG